MSVRNSTDKSIASLSSNNKENMTNNINSTLNIDNTKEKISPLIDNNGDINNYNGDKKSESIKVLVRMRPLNESELSSPTGYESVVDIHDDISLSLTNGDGKRTFQCSFDAILGSTSTQQDVYNTVQSCTESVLDGFNSTIFAYGQTGSGKTYSMYGPNIGIDSRAQGLGSQPENAGLIPRAISEIFELAKRKDTIQLSVYCSFVQIYNENLFDMLRDSSMGCPLTIREDSKEIYVQGLSEYNVKSINDTLQLLRIAEENRAIRETHMNQFSSRSHSIFQIYVEQKRVADDGGEVSLRAKFNLVDLAGSEKWNKQTGMRDEHIAEMNNINLSLHTLGRCISSLAQRSLGKDTHIPYRDSKLTRLLQDSLGGNAKTFLIATISPARINADESISTLKFADRAKQVMVQAILNETRPVDHAMVQRLQKEVEHLRNLLRQINENGGVDGTAVSSAMNTYNSNNTSNSQGMITNNSGNIINNSGNIINNNSLQEAIRIEKERNSVIIAENNSLKNEIATLVAQTRNQNTIKEPIIDKEKENIIINEAQRVLGIHIDQHNKICDFIDKLQIVVKNFFKFEIEEDDMKNQMEKIFNYLGIVRSQPIPTFPFQVDNSSPVNENNYNNSINNRNNNEGSASVPKPGRMNSENIRKAAYADLKNNLNPSSYSDLQNNNLVPSHSEPQFQSIQNMQHHLPVLQNNKQINASAPPLYLNIQPQGITKNSGNNSAPSRSGRYDSGQGSLNSPANQTAFPNKPPQHFQQNQNSNLTPRQRNVRQLSGPTLLNQSPRASQDNNGPSLEFRVRGSLESSGGWMAPEAAVDEEVILQKELKKAKKKLKKQQQLQEWTKEKEQRTLLALQAEENERKSIEEANKLKEQKRKEYVKKQKQKLAGFHDRIKSEAEQLQELINLGIDPEDLI
jgi:kinesin family protein 3/17